MRRNPNSFPYVHFRPAPAILAASSEPTGKASVQRGCNLCITDCMDRRFVSSLRFVFRMRWECIPAGADLLARATSPALSILLSPSRIVTAKARRPTGRLTAPPPMPRVDAHWLSFSVSCTQHPVGGQMWPRAVLHVDRLRQSFPASGLWRPAARSAESFLAPVVIALPDTTAAMDSGRPMSGLRSRATRLGPSWAGAWPRQAYRGRAAP